MTTSLRISLACGVILYLAFFLIMLKKKKLNLRYTLLWLGLSCLLIVLDLFPQIVSWIADFIGVQTPVNAIFLFFIFFILLILISLTSIVSQQHQQIKTLVQKLALLERSIENSSDIYVNNSSSMNNS